MDLQLNSNKAFISGSTQGIGFAIARQLVLEGAEVILNGREKEKLESAVARLKDKIPHRHVTGIAGDFSNSDQVDRLLRELGDIDILATMSESLTSGNSRRSQRRIGWICLILTFLAESV